MALTQSAQILLVTRRDPQDPIGRMLRGAGYPVVLADSADAALRTAERSRPALIVADLRALTTAQRGQLAAFARDYGIPLLQGWSNPEALLSEVGRLLSQPDSPGGEAPRLVVGPLEIDLATHSASLDGTHLDLTAREFDLLSHFARHPGWVYSRQELLEQVWGYEYGDPRVVTVHIANLRKKLEAAAPGTELIETVRNVGYRLVAAPVYRKTAPSSATLPETVKTETLTATPAEPVNLPALGDERRLVAVLFTRLSWLTAPAETRDPERMLELANMLFERVVPCLEGYGGRVDRFIGDSVMALFGAPVAHDNDAEMAVRAALDIRSCVESFRNEHQIEGLSAHIGVGTGLVVVGSVGQRTARQYSVIGDAVNTASHLAELSSPGEIFIDPETFRLVGHLVETEETASAAVRGRTEEITVRQVLRERPGPKARRPLGSTSALVGREREMQILRTALDGLPEQKGGIIFLMGEAGLGKSRLLAEASKEASERGLNWVEGRALSFGEMLSYWPLKEILETELGLAPDDEAATRSEKLARRLKELLGESDKESVPYLSLLLGLPLSEEFSARLEHTPDDMVRRQLFDAVTAVLRGIAKEYPMVLVFEDVHWLDASSAALVTYLLPLTKESPLLFCLAGRPEPESEGSAILKSVRERRPASFQEIWLDPLMGSQVHQLISALLDSAQLPFRLAQMIEEKAGGNPLFVEEIVKSLVDSGTLRHDDGGSWTVAHRISEAAIPDSLRGVIAARVDALPEQPKSTLRVASVVGERFGLSVIASVLGRRLHTIAADVGELEKLDFIHLRGRHPESTHAFKHALVREAVYDGILVRERRLLHEKVAQTLERLFEDRIPDLAGVLAYHYSQAGDWVKAQEFLTRAGDQAMLLAADSEGIRHYQRAMDAMLQAFDATWQVSGFDNAVDWFVERTEILRKVYRLSDLLPAVIAFHEKVTAEFGAEDRRALATAQLLGTTLAHSGRFEEAKVVLETTLAAYDRKTNPDDSCLPGLLRALSAALRGEDRLEESEQVLRRALSIAVADRSRHAAELPVLYLNLSGVIGRQGQVEEAKRLMEEALELPEVRDSPASWLIMASLAQANINAGHFKEAEKLARASLAGCTGLYAAAAAAGNLGVALHSQRAFAEAEHYLVRAVDTFETLGQTMETAECLSDLAETQLQAGRIQDSERTARRALAVIEESCGPEHSVAAWAWWTLCGAAMADGRLSEALSLMERAREIAQSRIPAAEPFHAELAFREAKLLCRLDRTEEAEASFAAACAVFEKLGGDEHPRLREIAAEWAALA